MCKELSVVSMTRVLYKFHSNYYNDHHYIKSNTAEACKPENTKYREGYLIVVGSGVLYKTDGIMRKKLYVEPLKLMCKHNWIFRMDIKAYKFNVLLFMWHQSTTIVLSNHFTNQTAPIYRGTYSPFSPII